MFDPIRKKQVKDTPEEFVRQYIVQVLLSQMNVPIHLMDTEFSLSAIQKGNEDRVDIIVHDLKQGKNKPWLLVECKAENEYTFESLQIQVNRYLKVLTPKYILLALGNKTKVYALTPNAKSFYPIAKLPKYEKRG